MGWSARLVVGHLADSARIFAERIHRVRTEVGPRLVDFVTDEGARIDRYLNAVPGHLVEELEVAQDLLEAALAEIDDAELSRTATHDVDGPLTLGDIVAFLPDASARPRRPAEPAGGSYSKRTAPQSTHSNRLIE